ncbi:MAG: permease DsdX [Verrucomicrobia bacterium]|nr:permease DsdX [Verrucomicrobiota bacterium]
MPGLSHNASLLLYTLIAIVALILLIAKVKLNAFVALILASLFVGLCAGMNLPDIGRSFGEGVGAVLSSVAIVVGLGTILGKLLAESGGAEVVAHTLIRAFGEKRMHWAMLVIAFVVGIPVWFTVGLVLLIPIVFTLARETRTPLLRLGIPLVAGLSVAHGLVPPHPGPMAAIELLKADPGKTILYSILVGLPTAIIAGPIFGRFATRKIHVELGGIGAQLTQRHATKSPPAFSLTLLTILAPILLMMAATLVDVLYPAAQEKFDLVLMSAPESKRSQILDAIRTLKPVLDATGAEKILDSLPSPLLSEVSKPDAEVAKKHLESAGAISKVQGNPIRAWSGFLGHPTVAMLVGVLFSFYSFGIARGFDRQQISRFADECLGPVALVLLVVGAGGGFSRVLVTSGVGGAIADLVKGSAISPLLLGWFVAVLIRVATGSATVAISTAAGILAPIVLASPSTNRELLIIAMGAGSAILSHLNDGGFWFVKEYLNMSVEQTLKTWTVLETIISFAALALVLLLDALV